MEEGEILKKLEESAVKPTKKPNKLFLRLLKYLGKLESGMQYEDYVRKQIKIPLIEWIIQTIILRALLIFLCLSAIGLFLPPPLKVLLIAEGLSIIWYLLVELKRDLWRKS